MTDDTTSRIYLKYIKKKISSDLVSWVFVYFPGIVVDDF